MMMMMEQNLEGNDAARALFGLLLCMSFADESANFFSDSPTSRRNDICSKLFFSPAHSTKMASRLPTPAASVLVVDCCWISRPGLAELFQT